MQNPETPKHFVKKDKLESVLAAWRRQAAGWNFQVLVEEDENGDFYLQALPYKAVEDKAPDGEVWMATVSINCSDSKLLTNEFIRDRYIRPVKRSANVGESVVLLPYRYYRGTKFTFQASSNVPTSATERTRAAMSGFCAQLKAWLQRKKPRLVNRAEEYLIAAIESVE